MKLHKILPIIFFMIAMMISCSQETVINENISGEATTPDTKICVNIKTENSRTVRPEITKWEITVTNKSDANLKFSRTIDGKATSATFVNVTDGEYDITVRGFNKDNKIILKNGSNSFYIKPNTVNVCEIIPEDNFDTSTRKGILDITVKISGLKDLFSDDKTIIAKITNNSESKSIDLYFNSEKTELTGEITEIIPGSYKIEISNSKNLNLVKDPVVNIYPETTTEINWEWNYDSDEINTDQDLKGIKIPVWNKSTEGNIDSTPIGYGEAWIIPARNGYLTANALFAEPIWDNDKSYNFTYTDEDTDEEGKTTITKYTSEIPASEFDFINCAYDDNRGLWVLSGTKSIISFYDENDEPYVERFCYVLKNLSTGDEYNVTTDENEKILKDFAVATVGEQKYLLCITDTADGNNIKSFKIEGEGGDLDDGTPYYGGNQYITAIYAKGDQLYIAISDIENETGSRFIKILKTELAADGSDNILEYKDDDGSEVLKLDINSFIEVENGYSFQSPAFAISDMYINEDKTKLYVTAGCVNYDGNSWNNNQDYRVYHSFGGLFEYELSIEDNKITCSNSDEPAKYGVYNGDNVNSPFLFSENNKISLANNIIQATNADSKYFAGPRYIIPSGNDLLIVDSGFYGVYTTPNDNPPLTDCEKRNRIFTFNTGTKGLSLTTLDDSISFDYDYLTSSLQN